MLNLPQQTILKIKTLLTHQKREVMEQLNTLEKDDPAYDTLPESTEPGTESWTADVHTRLTTLRNDLKGFYTKISDSLVKINKGTYGKCEGCGKEIEHERLEAMPTATSCLSCSKKSKKR